jgi:hypothetical protein
MTAIVDAYADRLKTSKEPRRLDALLVHDPEWKNAWRSIGAALSQDCSSAASAGSYGDPTGAGGIGAPSRSAFVDRRVLLTPDSLAGLFLLSLLPSDDFFASSPFLGCEAGLNAIG